MIYAGTGHRPNKLGGYSQGVTNKLIQLAKTSLTEDKVTKVISGMALGWDMALAEAAIELDIPFIAAVPFFGQEKMWPKESQERYHRILEKAEDIIYVCDKGYAPWKMQIRNEWMVNNCDTVLALWDGSKGGTGNCIQYANKTNKPIQNIWNQFKGNN